MAAVIGWYGPLIDLCKASLHIGDYVQILVFVHRSTPIQYKISRNGGEVVRTDILVGDDTRAYFPVTIWQKQIGSKIVAGHIILLQNMRITRFGGAFEARTLHCSSLQCLIDSNESLALKGVDELIGQCHIGATTKDKLQKVILWVKRAGFTGGACELNHFKYSQQVQINWKLHEETHSQDCMSLNELCQLPDSCKATVHASVGEIFLPVTWRHLNESEVEKMFISRRLYMLDDTDLVDDFISTGCWLCGSVLNAEIRSSIGQKNIPLYCKKSCDRLHVVATIYRPFMLYVWDDFGHIPLLVTNKAAELLFGNIQAEKIHSCFKPQTLLKCDMTSQDNRSCQVKMSKLTTAKQKPVNSESSSIDKSVTTAKRKPVNSESSSIDKSVVERDKCQLGGKTNFYRIWLILLKMLLQQGNNSPLQFKVLVNTSRDWECGRFELISVSMPSF